MRWLLGYYQPIRFGCIEINEIDERNQRTNCGYSILLSFFFYSLFIDGNYFRRCSNWSNLVGLTWPKYLKLVQRGYWKCLIYIRKMIMVKRMVCFGGMIQRTSLVALRLKSETFIFWMELKVGDNSIELKRKQMQNVPFFADRQFQMTVCEEDSIYSVQRKYCQMLCSEYREHCIWRKDKLLVRRQCYFFWMFISMAF